MKVLKIFFLSLLILFLATSCDDDLAIDTAPLGEEIQINIRESVIVADFGQLSYLSLVNDSRCPFLVQCLFDGNANVHVSHDSADSSKLYSLTKLNSIYKDSFLTVNIDDTYSITLIDVFPDPSLQDSPTDSLIVVRVDEL